MKKLSKDQVTWILWIFIWLILTIIVNTFAGCSPRYFNQSNVIKPTPHAKGNFR